MFLIGPIHRNIGHRAQVKIDHVHLLLGIIVDGAVDLHNWATVDRHLENILWKETIRPVNKVSTIGVKAKSAANGPPFVAISCNSMLGPPASGTLYRLNAPSVV